MDWILPFIVGWCGTMLLRIKIPKGGGGGGGDDPWPTGCPECLAVVGGIAAIILEALLRPQLGDISLGTRMAFDVFAGGFGASLVSWTGGRLLGRR